MPITFRLCVLLALGGAFGTLARFFLGMLAAPISQTLPWGTILINVAGSFAIGFFGTLTLDSGRFPLGEEWRLFFMVGVCGGFTTFSAFSLQTLELLRQGAWERAVANASLSLVLCVTAVALAHSAAQRFNPEGVAVAQISLEDEA